MSAKYIIIIGDTDDIFLCTGVSGFDRSDIFLGRPYVRRVPILWCSNLYANVIFIDTKGRRICAIRLVNDSLRLFLVNVYMPYEENDVMT